MKNLISTIISNFVSVFKKYEFERLFAGVLVAFVLLTSQLYIAKADRPIGERIAEQQHETSVQSERPKTTGEFLDEVEGDIPLNERLNNITRDSAEAFKQFGEGITNSVKEGTRELGDNITGQ